MHYTNLLLIIASLLISSASIAQKIDFNKDSLSYKISDSNLTAGKTDLHRKAQGWVIDNFGNEKQVIRLDDMDTGELTGEAVIRPSSKDSTTILFRVSSRDRQYECEIYQPQETGKQPLKQSTATDRKIRSLLKDLHQRMHNDRNFAKPSVDTIPKL